MEVVRVDLSQAENPPVLQIQSVTLSAGVITLAWTAIPGQTYQVQSTPSLSPGAWTTLSSVTATGVTAAATNSIAQAGTRFYRLVTAP
jgi:hypothetical protein